MTGLPLGAFDFDLPSELIAQHPCDSRDESSLLHFNRSDGCIRDRVFRDIVDILPKNSVIVLNDTKVMKARVQARRKTGACVECFFFQKIAPNRWHVLLKNGQRVGVGETLVVHADHHIVVVAKHEGSATVDIVGGYQDTDFLDAFGEPPLPPYIKSDAPHQHESRYQSVFATHLGAVAAPTAGLHFTHDLLAQLNQNGIDTIYITLHVGLGTFSPIQTTMIEEHTMHSESYIIHSDAAIQLNQAKQAGRPIIAVGTTVTRCLESNIRSGMFHATMASTDLFIHPGHAFRAIDGLITNFHLPKSSLLILVASLIGLDTVQRAYRHAIDHRYRFFSYGDAMLIT